jgi:hypothetical protein
MPCIKCGSPLTSKTPIKKYTIIVISASLR